MRPLVAALFLALFPALLAASSEPVCLAGSGEQCAPPASLKAHVFIATPMYGGSAQASYLRSLVELVVMLRDNNYGVEFQYISHESLITRARNSMVDAFLACAHCTHLLFLDADIGFFPEDVVRMLSSNKSLCGAAYPKKGGINWRSVAALARKDPTLPSDELAHVSGTYVINFIEGTQEITLDEPVEVKELGTGLMLIQRNVFSQLAAAYPAKSYIPEGREGDAAAKRVWAFFDTAIDPVSGRYLSEDFVFCGLWRALGGQVWLCPWVRTTHTGPFELKGDLREVSQRLGSLVHAD
jgi:hypothetical protein